jgi:hypothetical protein
VLISFLILNKGGPFEDEIDDNLRHSGRGILSMANSGAHTNRVIADNLTWELCLFSRNS